MHGAELTDNSMLSAIEISNFKIPCTFIVIDSSMLSATEISDFKKNCDKVDYSCRSKCAQSSLHSQFPAITSLVSHCNFLQYHAKPVISPFSLGRFPVFPFLHDKAKYLRGCPPGIWTAPCARFPNRRFALWKLEDILAAWVKPDQADVKFEHRASAERVKSGLLLS